jgi:uncharacterized membrane protein YheB (UPF0754 family)
MNDKIRELLENAEQSDAIARNKWRIENREQLRKERKEKLKELMEKDKQQTAVSWFIEQLNSKYGGNDFLITHINEIEKAKEMEKEQKRKDFVDGYTHGDSPLNHSVIDKWYEKTYGGGEQ